MANDLRARIVAHLEARGIPFPGRPGHFITPSKVRAVVDGGSFDAVWGDEVRGVLDEMLGAGRWSQPRNAGQVLVITAPIPDGTWTVPHNGWHLDYQARGSARGLLGAQVFLFLDEVRSRAGGTAVIEGSHQLVDRARRALGGDFQGRSIDVRKRVKRTVPWVAELFSLRPEEDRTARFMEAPHDFEGIPLRVAELTGEPGDVVIMHPWMLHAMTPNCGDRARLVLTERVQAQCGR